MPTTRTGMESVAAAVVADAADSAVAVASPAGLVVASVTAVSAAASDLPAPTSSDEEPFGAVAAMAASVWAMAMLIT